MGRWFTWPSVVAILFVVQVSILESQGALVPMKMAKRLDLIPRFILHMRYLVITNGGVGFRKIFSPIFVFDIVFMELTLSRRGNKRTYYMHISLFHWQWWTFSCFLECCLCINYNYFLYYFCMYDYLTSDICIPDWPHCPCCI